MSVKVCNLLYDECVPWHLARAERHTLENPHRRIAPMPSSGPYLAINVSAVFSSVNQTECSKYEKGRKSKTHMTLRPFGRRYIRLLNTLTFLKRQESEINRCSIEYSLFHNLTLSAITELPTNTVREYSESGG